MIGLASTGLLAGATISRQRPWCSSLFSGERLEVTGPANIMTPAAATLLTDEDFDARDMWLVDAEVVDRGGGPTLAVLLVHACPQIGNAAESAGA
jgi:hypothetical protein